MQYPPSCPYLNKCMHLIWIRMAKVELCRSSGSIWDAWVNVFAGARETQGLLEPSKLWQSHVSSFNEWIFSQHPRLMLPFSTLNLGKKAKYVCTEKFPLNHNRRHSGPKELCPLSSENEEQKPTSMFPLEQKNLRAMQKREVQGKDYLKHQKHPRQRPRVSAKGRLFLNLDCNTGLQQCQGVGCL